MTATGRAATARIRVNGAERQVASGTTLESIVNARERGVAAAVNREVVPRALWSVTVLAEGDEVEIVQAVQGGAA